MPGRRFVWSAAGVGLGTVLCLAAPARGQTSCTPHLELLGEYADQYRSSIAGVGDLNGDGLPDFVVGAAGDNTGGVDSGRVWAFSGDGSELYVLDGPAEPYVYFGSSVSAVSDVDGDGHADFAVWSPGWQSYAGRVDVFSGIDGAPLFTYSGGSTLDYYGRGVGGAGDLNDDGHDDFIVGADRWDAGDAIDAGRAWVYSGSDGTVLFEFTGANAGDSLGSAAVGLGDLDGDGVPDFAIGARRFDAPGGGENFGRVYVHSGSDARVLYTITGDHGEGQLGYHVAPLDDMDGDGVPDFFIGGFHPHLVSGATGRSMILREDEFRYAKAVRAGDYDGDGSPDIIVPEFFSFSESPIGRVRVYSGLLDRLLAVYSTHFGRPFVSRLGDVSGDGRDDVLVSEYDFDDAGRVVVYLGHEAGPADLNGDGAVDFADVLALLAAWGPCTMCPADITHDSIVDRCDLDVVLASWD